MPAHRHIHRALQQRVRISRDHAKDVRPDRPQKLGATTIDISSLHLPAEVSCALGEAFWAQARARSLGTVRGYWHNLKIFSRFVAQTHTVRGLSDLSSTLPAHYIDWLNRQSSLNGTPWSKGTRSAAYTTLRTLLRWLQRCRPGLLGEIDYPRRPFPWKYRDHRRIEPLSALQLRAILKACESDIRELRVRRERAEQAMAAARGHPAGQLNTLGEFLTYIDEHHGGIIPPRNTLTGPQYSLNQAIERHGGLRTVEPCLYPRAESILPYYLAILIHTAGNPEAMTDLRIDCLQPVPLLNDRELLVWNKARAGTPQRRAFRSTDSFEPPTLVREIVLWTQRLRTRAPLAQRARLFLYKSPRGVTALSLQMAHLLHQRFAAAHGLPYFTLASIRPSVLTAFYRAYGDLRPVKEIANHAQLSTTVAYVEGPEVARQNRTRIATFQSAFLDRVSGSGQASPKDRAKVAPSFSSGSMPSGHAVSLLGFDCKDPFAGIAPGVRQGEFCTHFLGCFTCPNAVIPVDATSLARFLQTRDHLHAARGELHPARWETIYAPQLRILEEDILTRFSPRELVAAQTLRSTLPPLPPLR